MHILEIVGQERPDWARIDQIRMILVLCHSQTGKMSSGSAEKAKTQEHVAPIGILETPTTEFLHRGTRAKFVSPNSLDIKRPQPCAEKDGNMTAPGCI